MESKLNRRDFLGAGVATAAVGLAGSRLAGLAGAATAGESRYKKSLMFGMVPKAATLEDRVKMAKDAGFEAIEVDTMSDPKEVEAMKSATQKNGIHVEAIVCSKHWSHPLSDPDPKVAEQTMEAMRVSLKNAKDLGAGVVLLVPAVVTPKVRYADAYSRSQERIRQLIPVAQENNSIIAVEDVWNKFLLSPIEFKRYLDEINSPFVRSWFDVGNIVAYGYPQDWIRTLGNLIVRVHIKDFDANKHQWKPLREGSIDWPEVMRAFGEVNYKGYIAAEVEGGDLAHLTEVAKRMDLIFEGK